MLRDEQWTAVGVKSRIEDSNYTMTASETREKSAASRRNSIIGEK